MGRFEKYVSSLSAGGDGKVWDLGWNGASTMSHSWLMRVQTSSGIASLKGSLSRSDARIGVKNHPTLDLNLREQKSSIN